jgi:hypothetical protein
MAAVIPVKISVTVLAIVARRLHRRLIVVTALTRIVTQIPTAMMLTAWVILHVHTAVMLTVIQVTVIQVKINVTVPAIVENRLRQRLTAVTVLTRTVTPLQTAKMKTALMIRLVFVK